MKIRSEELVPGRCELVIGDCTEILDTVGSVWPYNCIITDPPYGTGHWKRERKEDHLCKPEKKEWDEWDTSWLSLVHCPDRVISFCPQTKLKDFIGIAESGEIPWRLLMWIKANPNPRPFGTRVLDNGFDPIFCFGRVRGRGLDWKLTGTRHDTLPRGCHHPHQKPLSLMRWLVRLACPPGGTVLDPFGGSGTTAVASLLEGRNCVVIEREEEYCETVRRRLDRPWPKPQWVSERGGLPLLTDPEKFRTKRNHR
jgi:site-specific DNA-methyltransferase (adenine-specific)